MNCKLRPLEPQDIELLYTIENDRDMWNVGNTNVPYSRYDLENYILTQQHDIYADKQLRLVISVDDRPVGLVDLFNFSPAHHRAELGLAILRSEQGKGYAAEALRQMNDYAANVLHLHQLYCIVAEDNVASITMLRGAGYADETSLKDWIFTGKGYTGAIALFKFLYVG